MRLFALFLIAACGPVDSGTTTPAGGTTPAGTPGTVEPTPLRVVTWNVQTLGASTTDEYLAVRDVLARIDADVVILNELEGHENPRVEELAAELGYGTVVAPTSNPFGDLHNAVLARVPGTGGVHRSADLSGDTSANDVTRLPVSFTVDGGPSFVGMHCKSGFDDVDEFRRTVDAIRMTQAGADPSRTVIMGDINQEVDEAQDSPRTFTDFPYGMPGSYYLGEDLYAEMTGPGLGNGPFPHFEAAGFAVVDAAQLDGDLGTRWVSGRRIDYQLVGSGLADAVVASEIYNSRHDDGSGLATAEPAPDRRASEIASDHLPVVVDYLLD